MSNDYEKLNINKLKTGSKSNKKIQTSALNFGVSNCHWPMPA